jgi:hypothetical protein
MRIFEFGSSYQMRAKNPARTQSRKPLVANARMTKLTQN